MKFNHALFGLVLSNKTLFFPWSFLTAPTCVLWLLTSDKLRCEEKKRKEKPLYNQCLTGRNRLDQLTYGLRLGLQDGLGVQGCVQYTALRFSASFNNSRTGSWDFCWFLLMFKVPSNYCTFVSFFIKIQHREPGFRFLRPLSNVLVASFHDF